MCIISVVEFLWSGVQTIFKYTIVYDWQMFQTAHGPAVESGQVPKSIATSAYLDVSGDGKVRTVLTDSLPLANSQNVFIIIQRDDFFAHRKKAYVVLDVTTPSLSEHDMCY